MKIDFSSDLVHKVWTSFELKFRQYFEAGVWIVFYC